MKHIKVYALCQDNPGEAKHTPNCLNAFAAIQKASSRELGNQLAAARGETLIEQCDQMPPLFQAANRCGAYRPK
jgi:hypothetical protein